MKKFTVVLLLITTSCAPVYIPNLRNAPMFQKGGEVQGSFQVGNGLEVQGAWAINNNLGIMGNYSYLRRDDVDNTKDYRRHTFFEGALGYFKNSNEGSTFEVFAGYGKGEGSSYDEYFFNSSAQVQASGKYERYFIQPTIGFNKKAFHGGFVSRFSFVDFKEFSDGTTTYVDEKSGIWFFEPAFVGKINTADNRVFFTFQTGLSLPLLRDNYFDHRTFTTGIGIGFRLGGGVGDQSPDSN
jgi:hypothetical protein